MAAEGASFLFGGTHFDRKRFAADFALFQVKKEETKDSNMAEAAESDSEEEEEEAVEKQVKKRKRKTDASSSETGDGISLFKKSKSAKADKKEKEKPGKERAKEKKKLNKQLERDSLLRKKHNVHVSGNNIPSPLESFTELKSRFGCEEYLLRNLAELGFEEPTPIQSQAIPILSSGRECFACAPTGSGKSFAFVVPMLMKLKHASKDDVRAVILCPTRELAAQTTRVQKVVKRQQI